MEITLTIKGLELLAESINNLASTMGGNKTTSSVQMPLTAPPQTPPATQCMPATTLVAQTTPPVTPVIPTTHVAQGYTQEQIGRALCSARDAGKMNVVQNIFTHFGVSNMMEIPRERYGEVVSLLMAEGIRI